jgi:hypothetical protein
VIQGGDSARAARACNAYRCEMCSAFDALLRGKASTGQRPLPRCRKEAGSIIAARIRIFTQRALSLGMPTFQRLTFAVTRRRPLGARDGVT